MVNLKVNIWQHEEGNIMGIIPDSPKNEQFRNNSPWWTFLGTNELNIETSKKIITKEVKGISFANFYVLAGANSARVKIDETIPPNAKNIRVFYDININE